MRGRESMMPSDPASPTLYPAKGKAKQVLAPRLSCLQKETRRAAQAPGKAGKASPLYHRRAVHVKAIARVSAGIKWRYMQQQLEEKHAEWEVGGTETK